MGNSRRKLDLISVMMILLGVLAMAAAILTIMVGEIAGSATNSVTAGVVGIVSLICSVVEMIAGALGRRFASGSGKAGGCMCLGVLLIIGQIITFVLNLMSGVQLANAIAAVVWVIMMVLYMKYVREVDML